MSDRVFDYVNKKFIEKPDKVKKFLDEIKKVCEEYQLSIWKQGNYEKEFIIEKYNEKHIKALEQACVQLEDVKKHLSLEDGISEMLIDLGINIHGDDLTKENVIDFDNFGCVIPTKEKIKIP